MNCWMYSGPIQVAPRRTSISEASRSLGCACVNACTLVKELERQLLFGNGLMALLTDGERLLVKEHVLEEHTWPIIQSIFKEQWKVEPDAIPTQRAFQMRLNRAFKKLMEVCTRRLDFDFLSECGDLKVELNDK